MMWYQRLAITFFLFVVDKTIAQCPLCYDGSTPPDFSFAPPGFDGLTCGTLIFAAGLGSPGVSCNEWIVAGMLCGCPKPPGGCDLCFDGSEPPDLALEPAGYEGANCIQFLAAAGNPEPQPGDPTCDDWLENGLLCNCPKPANACSLCEDGSSVIDPDRRVGTATCREYENKAVFTVGDECTAWQATAGVYCGCNNPVASQNYNCRVCGSDILLSDPGKTVAPITFSEPTTCLLAERNLDELVCSDVQSEYADLCCDAPTASPTKNPTGSPTKNPTFSPTSSPVNPTASPVTPIPTAAPTELPTSPPTNAPINPTASPVTPMPTASPISSPSSTPTKAPVITTDSPTFSPSHAPVQGPPSRCCPFGYSGKRAFDDCKTYYSCEAGVVVGSLISCGSANRFSEEAQACLPVSDITSCVIDRCTEDAFPPKKTRIEDASKGDDAKLFADEDRGNLNRRRLRSTRGRR